MTCRRPSARRPADASVSGVVTVRGRAASTDFQSYRLEYGAGASPAEWIVISQGTTPVTDGALGMWDTSALAPGQYTLRLVVKDHARGELIALATVSVTAKSTAAPDVRRRRSSRRLRHANEAAVRWTVNDEHEYGFQRRTRRPLSDHEEPPGGQAPEGNGLERYGRYRVPRRQEPLRPDLQLSEIRRGLKPGSRYVRITPSSQQTLRRMAPAHLQATAVLLRPQNLPGRALDRPQARPRRHAADDLAGDPRAAGQGARAGHLLRRRHLVHRLRHGRDPARPRTGGHGRPQRFSADSRRHHALLIVVAFSYRQTVRAYPSGGGSYTVARENLGTFPGLTAAVGADDRLRPDRRREHVRRDSRHHLRGAEPLQRASGDGADCRLAHRDRQPAGNPRVGKIFAIPTYLFIFTFAAMIVTGFVRYAMGVEAPPPRTDSSGHRRTHPVPDPSRLLLRMFRSHRHGGHRQRRARPSSRRNRRTPRPPSPGWPPSSPRSSWA